MTTITSSNKFSLNISDWWKGLLMAVLTPVFAILMDSINHGELIFQWKIILGAALAGALAYLSKNFFDSAKIVITDPNPQTIADVKKGNAKVTITNPHG